MIELVKHIKRQLLCTFLLLLKKRFLVENRWNRVYISWGGLFQPWKTSFYLILKTTIFYKNLILNHFLHFICFSMLNTIITMVFNKTFSVPKNILFTCLTKHNQTYDNCLCTKQKFEFCVKLGCLPSETTFRPSFRFGRVAKFGAFG